MYYQLYMHNTYWLQRSDQDTVNEEKPACEFFWELYAVGAAEDVITYKPKTNAYIKRTVL